jgi:hypothetical protein
VCHSGQLDSFQEKGEADDQDWRVIAAPMWLRGGETEP